jgi:hypothetical protein
MPISLEANMLKDMALMMGAQVGASVANQDITKEFSDTSKAVQADQSILNNATNNFFTNISTAQKNQMNNISAIFSGANSQIATIANQQQQQAQDAQSYIQSVTSLQQPSINYLDNPILYDQLFTNGTMYTPKGQIWKNVFQIGDWEFDESDSSFWQYKNIPFISKETNTIQDAFKNLIFTEWNTHQPYEIICDITLYKVSYPFYVGIVFNKARWVSGDTYGLQKYRTLGIYGDANKKISLCFAEQKIPPQAKKSTTTATAPTTVPLPITPLEQIYQNQGIQNSTINQKAFNNLQNNKVTFHIKIKPGPNTIMYKVWGANSPEPSKYTTISTSTTPTTNTASSTSINSNNLLTVSDGSGDSITYLAANYNDIYLYHGIGFLSSGAVAQFKLKTPTNILFTEKNLSVFTDEVSNYFKDQQYKFTSQQLLASTAGGA